MFGSAVLVAAVLTAAGPGEPTVRGEMGAVRPLAGGAEGASPAATPTPAEAATGAEAATAAPTATASSSTSTSTSASTTTSSAVTSDPTPAPTSAAMSAATPENVAAAPAGPPLAEVVPVVVARRAWSDGSALERLIEPSGDIVLHVVTPAGTVVSCTPVGSLYALPIESQTDAAGGEVVHVVRDDSGARIRYVVQADGEPRAVTVIEPATLPPSLPVEPAAETR